MSSIVQMCDTWPLQSVFIDYLAQVIDWTFVDPFFPARPLVASDCIVPLSVELSVVCSAAAVPADSGTEPIVSIISMVLVWTRAVEQPVR